MSQVYMHHRIEAAPRGWKDLAAQIVAAGGPKAQAEGGALYGVWRSQIGRPRDELTAVSVWPDASTARRASSARPMPLS